MYFRGHSSAGALYSVEAYVGSRDGEVRDGAGYAAMDQDHPRLAQLVVWEVADLDAVVERLGGRVYRGSLLEAGIRAGRLQVGAFIRAWGAAASTFFDPEVSRFLGTNESPLLLVAVGRR